MSYINTRHWPMKSVLRYLGPVTHGNPKQRDEGFTTDSATGDASTIALAELTGFSRRTIQRWRSTGVPDRHADTVAIRLGCHPCVIWPSWFSIDLEEAG